MEQYAIYAALAVLLAITVTAVWRLLYVIAERDDYAEKLGDAVEELDSLHRAIGKLRRHSSIEQRERILGIIERARDKATDAEGV